MSAKSEHCHVLDNQKRYPVLNPILKVILEGVYDEECSLSAFRGCPHIVMKIWIEVKKFWKAKINKPSKKNEDNLLSSRPPKSFSCTFVDESNLVSLLKPGVDTFLFMKRHPGVS